MLRCILSSWPYWLLFCWLTCSQRADTGRGRETRVETAILLMGCLTLVRVVTVVKVVRRRKWWNSWHRWTGNWQEQKLEKASKR